MRSESGGAAMIRARLTHRIAAGVAGRSGDALAVVQDGPLPAATTIFVSGRLPCGECPACRRALCEACVGLRPLESFSSGDAGDVRDARSIAVPERFITAIGEPLAAGRAIAAGIVADVIGAAGRAGLGAGDTAIWMGEPAWTRVGASWSGGRGCRTFVFGAAAVDSDVRTAPTPSSTAPSSSPVSPAPQVLALNAGPATWRVQIAETEAAGGPAGGRPERRIFVCGADPELATAALDLVTAGTTISFLRGAPATLRGLDGAPPLRIFTGGAGHPDLIPEALAALRRGEVDVDGLFLEVAPGDEAAALAAYRRGTGRAIPMIILDPTG